MTREIFDSKQVGQIFLNSFLKNLPLKILRDTLKNIRLLFYLLFIEQNKVKSFLSQFFIFKIRVPQLNFWRNYSFFFKWISFYQIKISKFLLSISYVWQINLFNSRAQNYIINLFSFLLLKTCSNIIERDTILIN